MENKIKIARQCLDYKGINCDNKSCKNKSCPLNEKWKKSKKSKGKD